MVSSDIALGFFISKIIACQYRLQANKGRLSIFGGYHHKKTENGTFLDNWPKNLQVSHTSGNKPKMTESDFVLFD